jgi:hypothetical protein
MKKILLAGFALSFYSVCNVSFAAFGAYIPLENINGGRLPDGSIIIGSGGVTNPSNPNNPTNPTDPTTPSDPGTPSDGNGTDCSFEDGTSSYSEGVASGNVFFLSKVYNGQMISNGTKGKFKSSQALSERDNQDYGVQNGVVNYYEICMNGEQPEAEQPVIIGPPPVVANQWKSNTCRSGNGYNDGYNYSWSEVSGDGVYDGQQLWTTAEAGDYGNFNYVNTGSYTPPAGAVNTAYGQYQNGNSMIGKGSVYLSKGTNLIKQSVSGGRTVYVYDVCLHIAN